MTVTRTSSVVHAHPWRSEPKGGGGSLHFEGSYQALRDIVEDVGKALNEAESVDEDAPTVFLELHKHGFKITSHLSVEVS